MNVIFFAALVLFLVWLDSSARAKRRIPSTTSPQIHRVSSQAAAYDIYKQNGLWGITVVHLNRFLNMADYAPREEIKSRPYPIMTNDVRPLYEKGLNSHNWLFIASVTGMVRSVTTVLPAGTLNERMEAFRADPFFVVLGRTVKGYSNDVPLTIVTLDDLPSVHEPVVLNVDAGFFLNPQDPLKAAMIVREKCPDIRMIILVDSVDEPGITADMHTDLDRFASAWREK